MAEMAHLWTSSDVGKRAQIIGDGGRMSNDLRAALEHRFLRDGISRPLRVVGIDVGRRWIRLQTDDPAALSAWFWMYQFIPVNCRGREE